MTDSTSPSTLPSAARGRPLDDELTRRVLETVRAEVAASGLASLRIEKVAASVGCGKTAIYRRWPNKPELVAAAIVDGLDRGRLPDNGDVVEDLIEHAWFNVENLRRTTGTTGANGLLLAMFDMDVIPLISEQYMSARHDLGLEILDRAVERGQIPAGLDHHLILDAIAGLTMFRLTLKPNLLAGDESSLKGTYRRLIRSLLTGTERSADPD